MQTTHTCAGLPPDKQPFDNCRMSTFDKIAPWEAISSCKIPIIAAVNVKNWIVCVSRI